MQRPRVAIIGAGIFGVSCALELGKWCDVIVYEQNDEIMRGGTYGNQYRHHYGYHYPRSSETVRQCQEAEKDFMAVWGKAIIRDFPAYYAIAKHDSKVSAEEFMDFCKEHRLPHDIEYPDSEFLNREEVSVCIKTAEPVYDYARLRAMAADFLNQNQNIKIRTGHEVVGAVVEEESNIKKLLVKYRGETLEESFDYAVNAMYANHNLFGNWFGFPVSPLEFRLKELVVVDLPRKTPIAVTIMDGSFVTLVPMGVPGQFTLGDVARSIHDTRISSGGIPWSVEERRRPSRFEEMKKNNPRFIPIVKEARYIQSIFSVLPVRPNSNSTDARLTAITNHGRGCWSVFEGKIITCVTAAEEVGRQMLAQQKK